MPRGLDNDGIQKLLFEHDDALENEILDDIFLSRTKVFMNGF